MAAPKFWPLLLATLLTALVFGGPASVRADSSVVVLGVRSLDGDDAIAQQVSVALRQSAKRIAGWNVSDRDVSLAQMSLAHGCDEPDARCMADIASTLSVDRLIYGTMLRVGDQVQLALFNFDAVTGQVESSLEQRVTAAELAEPALEATMATLVKRLAGEKVAGMLRVMSDTPGATVTLDGKPAGTLDVRGELLMTEVAAGPHTLVLANAGTQKEQVVEVAEATTTTIRVGLRTPGSAAAAPVDEAPPADEPEPEQPTRNWRRIVGWSSVGLAGVLAAATVASWVKIDSINKDADLKAYRAEWAGPGEVDGTSDVCREAEDGGLVARPGSTPADAALEASARDLCNQADTFEVLQYVFLSGAVVAGGVGAYLLISDRRQRQAGQVRLVPRFGVGRASLAAHVTF